MNILEEELNSALSQLTSQLEAKPGAEGGPLLNEASQKGTAVQSEPVDAEFARELFEKIEPLLAMGNPECRKFIDSLRLIPGSEELIQQIEDFDFEPAVATLAKLKNRPETT